MQPVEAFNKAENEYQRLQAQHEAGQLTEEQFTAALQALMVEYEGRYWMPGANSDSWYVYEGQAWMPAQPPTAEPGSRATHSDTVMTEHADRPLAQLGRFTGAGLDRSPAALSQPAAAPGEAGARPWLRERLTAG